MKLKQPICKKQEKIGRVAAGKTKKGCKRTTKCTKKRGCKKISEYTLF